MKEAVLLFLQAMAWLVPLAQPVTTAVAVKSGKEPSTIRWIKYEIDTALSDLTPFAGDKQGQPDFTGQQLQTVLPAHVYYTHGNTVAVLIEPGRPTGCGLRVIMAGDSCRMFYLDPADDITIATLKCRLVLSKKPAPLTDRPICGKIEFEGRPQHGNNGGGETGMQYWVYGRFQAPGIKQ